MELFSSTTFISMKVVLTYRLETLLMDTPKFQLGSLLSHRMITISKVH